MEQKKSIWIKLFYFIATFLLITWSFSISSYVDEDFSLGLIRHSWSQIITLDAMDVHPPLYYLTLKVFLNITTFWTSSMVIKTIFSRIFSVICFAIMSKGIQVIFKITLNKKINFFIIFLGLILLPNVLYHATCIRMYAFGAMLIIWELICLLKFRQKNRFTFLIYALILAELAAYTHYFAAIIAGLLIFYEFISYIKNKQYRSAIKTGIIGCLLFILFIPWATIAFKQISTVSQHYWMPNSLNNFVDLFYYRAFPISVFFFIGFILLILLTILCYKKGSVSFKKIYRRVLFSFYGTMFLGIAISFLIRPIFQSRYLFFIFPLYLCLTCFELSKIMKNNKKSLKIIEIAILVFLSLGLIRNSAKGVYFIINNYNTCKQLNFYNNKNDKEVILPSDINTYVPLRYSLYLPNKTIIIHQSKKSINQIKTGNDKNDQKLFNEIFPNIKSIK